MFTPPPLEEEFQFLSMPLSPQFSLMWVATSPPYHPKSPPLSPHHLPSSVLSPQDFPTPLSTAKYEFRITPSLTWAPPQSQVPLPPALEEMKENIPLSCQRA